MWAVSSYLHAGDAHSHSAEVGIHQEDAIHTDEHEGEHVEEHSHEGEQVDESNQPK
jgi:hypothetical protein